MKYAITQDIDIGCNYEEGLKFIKQTDLGDIKYFESPQHKENNQYFKERRIAYTEVIKFGLDKE